MLHVPEPFGADGPSPVSLVMSRDADAFNRIANDPSVLPLIIPEGGSVDLGPALADDRNIGFLGDDCAFIAHCLETGVYEVHSMALPHVRGRKVLQAATAAIRAMFLSTPAMELLTRVVAGNVAADALTRKVGFGLEFERKGVWAGKDVRFYAMRYPEWVKRQDYLKSSGEWFHSILDEPSHDHDEAHDLYVGACVEMVMAGAPDKGVTMYNRWARFAGYQTIEIVERDPLVIDIRTHRIRIDENGIGVVKCL